MKLVTIIGKKRSGKDTCADFVIETMNSVKYQLAGPIKEVLYEAYNNLFNGKEGYQKLSLEDFEGYGIDREYPLVLNNLDVQRYFFECLNVLSIRYRLKNWFEKDIVSKHTINNTEPWTIRRLMQTLGTDIVVNDLDRMFWMKLFAYEYYDNIVSSAMPDYFVVPDVRQVHEIEALRSMGATVIHVVRSDTADSTDAHITEQGLPILPNDTVIVNDGTLEELFENIKKVL